MVLRRNLINRMVFTLMVFLARSFGSSSVVVIDGRREISCDSNFCWLASKHLTNTKLNLFLAVRSAIRGSCVSSSESFVKFVKDFR